MQRHLPPHEKLALTIFDSHQKCSQSWTTVFDTQIKGVGALLRSALTQLWLASKLYYHAFDSSQRRAKVPLMHALAIFDKTFDHSWFESKVCHIWLKTNMAFDSRQKWSKVWSNMAFDTYDIWQRRGVKAIFRAVFYLKKIWKIAFTPRLCHMSKVSKAIFDQTFYHFGRESKAIFDLSQMWYTFDLNQKCDQRFCQIWLARASKIPLLTFDSSQRHDNFDVSQSCVKADVKSAPTPLIRVSKMYSGPTLTTLLMRIKDGQSQLFMQCKPSGYIGPPTRKQIT